MRSSFGMEDSGSSAVSVALASPVSPTSIGIAESEPGRIAIDLHGMSLARLRVELQIGKGRSDDEEGIALFERELRSSVPRSPMPPVV